MVKYENFKQGDKVVHLVYGKGVIEKNVSNQYAEVYLVRYKHQTVNSSASLLV